MLLKQLAVAASMTVVCAALWLDGPSLPLAEAACATGNEADLVLNGAVNVNVDGEFSFGTVGTWELESDPSWVTLQLASTGSSNVINVVYTPSFLQNEDCIEMTGVSFSVIGDLKIITSTGNVNSKLDAGIAPDHASAILATFIPSA